MSTLAVQAYRDCYAACRAQGGSIQACEEQCASLMPGNVCDPCCGLWDCFATDVGQTVTSATGAVWQYASSGAFSGLVKWAVIGVIALVALRVVR